jgi:hypothetical protein
MLRRNAPRHIERIFRKGAPRAPFCVSARVCCRDRSSFQYFRADEMYPGTDELSGFSPPFSG